MNSDHNQQSKKELRAFGLVTGAITALIFGLALPWLFSRAFPAWPWIFAVALWSAALILPMSLRPVFKAWMTIGHWLGWINTRIILGIMFYTVFFMVGVAMKSMGKDPMARKIDKTADSYRVQSRTRSSDHAERPF